MIDFNGSNTIFVDNATLIIRDSVPFNGTARALEGNVNGTLVLINTTIHTFDGDAINFDGKVDGDVQVRGEG